jgi:hypothetical protein
MIFVELVCIMRDLTRTPLVWVGHARVHVSEHAVDMVEAVALQRF